MKASRQSKESAYGPSARDGCTRQIALRIEGNDLLHKAAAGRSHQPQLVPVMDKGSGEHARLLQQIAIEAQRRDHVARIVRYLGQSLSVTAQRGEGFDDCLDPLAVRDLLLAVGRIRFQIETLVVGALLLAVEVRFLAHCAANSFPSRCPECFCRMHERVPFAP